MSTVRADNVAPAAGGTSRNLPRGVAGAWANLNGDGTIAVRDSVNVSSFTDHGAGDYTKNIASAMSDANYSTSISSTRSSTNTTLVNISRIASEATTPTASVIRLAHGVVAGDRTLQKEDTAILNTTIFGSLA